LLRAGARLGELDGQALLVVACRAQPLVALRGLRLEAAGQGVHAGAQLVERGADAFGFPIAGVGALQLLDPCTRPVQELAELWRRLWARALERPQPRPQ